MLPARCTCGFTELPDENLTDHLLAVFTPSDCIARDGRLHEETDGQACQCGFTAPDPAGMDAHFLAVFIPGDAIA